MSFRYKVDILQLLKDHGYNTNKIRQDKIIGQAMITKIRAGEMMSWGILDKVCELTDSQPGDLIEFYCDDKLTQEN